MNLDDQVVSVINNRLEAFPDLVATAFVYALDGTLQTTRRAAVHAAANQFTNCFAIELPALLSKVYFVRLELRNGKNELLSDNFYWRSRDLTDYTTLNTLPQVALDGAATAHADGEAQTLDVTLHNPSSTVALAIRLKLLREGSSGRVLPVYYGDNYFSLLPGEKRVVKIDFARGDLQGEEPRLEVEGWNIDPRKIPID